MKYFKSFMVTVLIFTMFFTLFGASKSEAATSYKKGDILITTATSYKGIAGHSAIAISSTSVIHTSGWSTEPYPRIMSIKDWEARYKNKVKVIRPTSSTLGAKAADQAIKYFKGKTIKYLPTSNPKDIDPYTYCSELVWYAYYKAGKSYQVNSGATPGNPNGTWKNPSIIYPYDFSNSTYVKHNGFKFIDSTW